MDDDHLRIMLELGRDDEDRDLLLRRHDEVVAASQGELYLACGDLLDRVGARASLDDTDVEVLGLVIAFRKRLVVAAVLGFRIPVCLEDHLHRLLEQAGRVAASAMQSGHARRPCVAMLTT
jgi:hypothetical protein